MPPPPGAGQAAAMNVPAQTQATLELTTEPSPRKRSKYRPSQIDRHGWKTNHRSAGQRDLFMAAMPAMGMAAMKTVVQANDKGGGMYEGSGGSGIRGHVASHDHSTAERADHRE